MSIVAVGPAIGARGQIGFSQEGEWGKKLPTPNFFIEMVNESVVSELGSLVSNALRADRAVHKSIRGVESAGGDIAVEVVAEGLGKMFKHALGSVETTRVDDAFAIVVTDGSVTSALLTISVNASGLATNLTVALTGGTGTGVNIDLGDSTSDTIGELMAEINGGATGLAAYSPDSYQGGGTAQTLESTDYATSTDASNLLQAVAAVELIGGPAGTKDFLVSFGWGVYSHLIDAAPTLPVGLTMEIGRDIAAFTYSGCKVNTLTLTAETGEIFGGTFNVMARGATTASGAVPASANTGNEKNAFKIKYTGEGATCTLEIDKANHQCIIDSATGAEDLTLDLSIPYTDPTTGRVYPVHTVGGLAEYLNNLSYITCSLAPYTNFDADSSELEDDGPNSITGTTYIWFNFDSTDQVAIPATWGDYKGEDAGESVDIQCEIVGGGVPGTATIRFSDDGGSSWGSTYTTSITNPTEIRVASNVDTGFTIFFPDNTALIASDLWTVSTFKLGETADYSDLDPFAGFDGALTIDGDSQPVMAWNCTLNNNLYGDKYDLGERQRKKLPEQRRTTEGTMTVEFDNLDLYRRFVNNTEGNLVMAFVHDDYIAHSSYTALGDSNTQYSMTIRQPKIRYDGTTPNIEDEGIIEVEMPYTSLHADTVPDLRITLVNGVEYL